MTPYIVPRQETSVEKTALKMLRYQRSRTLFSDLRKPYCDKPIPLTIDQRSSETQYAMRIERYVPCRACEKCLIFRRLRWRDRMLVELVRAPRSWFVTLTFSEIHLAGIIAEAHLRYDFVGQEQVEIAAYKHIQLFYKRLRKSGERFRYVAIAEYGEKTQRLHYHLLIHEIDKPLRWLSIDSQWRSFTNATLVRTSRRAAGYVCKYLTKANSLIRASTSYGQMGQTDVKP